MKRIVHAACVVTLLGLPVNPTLSAPELEPSISLKLFGSNPASRELPVSNAKTTSYFFDQAYQKQTQTAAPARPKAFYSNIYPGVDLTCYGDEYQLEYIFTVAPGADYSLIRLLFENIQSVSLSHAGGLRILLPGGEIIQRAPVVYAESGSKSQRLEGRYEMGYNGTVYINPGSHFKNKSAGMNSTYFNLIPAGGQPGGPDYDLPFKIRIHQRTTPPFPERC